MSDKWILIDTNILVYLMLGGTELRERVRQRVDELLNLGYMPVLTLQILREFFAVSTRRDYVERPLTPQEAVHILEDLGEKLTLLGESSQSQHQLYQLADAYQVKGKQIHDANIVAVMLSCGVREIFTANISDFSRYREICIHEFKL